MWTWINSVHVLWEHPVTLQLSGSDASNQIPWFNSVTEAYAVLGHHQASVIQDFHSIYVESSC